MAKVLELARFKIKSKDGVFDLILGHAYSLSCRDCKKFVVCLFEALQTNKQTQCKAYKQT